MQTMSQCSSNGKETKDTFMCPVSIFGYAQQIKVMTLAKPMVKITTLDSFGIYHNIIIIAIIKLLLITDKQRLYQHILLVSNDVNDKNLLLFIEFT